MGRWSFGTPRARHSAIGEDGKALFDPWNSHPYLTSAPSATGDAPRSMPKGEGTRDPAGT